MPAVEEKNHNELENDQSTANNGLNSVSFSNQSNALSSSEIDASSESDNEPSSSTSTSNINVSSLPNSKRTKMAGQKNTKRQALMDKKVVLNKPVLIPSPSLLPVDTKEEMKRVIEAPVVERQNSKVQKPTKKNIGSKNSTSDAYSSSNIKSSTNVSSLHKQEKKSQITTHKRPIIEREGPYPWESQFHAYMESSETRRREQERQINALYREQTLKTQVLCMFEQMTGVSIDVSKTNPNLYTWIQRGKAGIFECLIEHNQKDTIYHYTPKVLPESINEMDENYKTFKNEMYFDTSQLELFFNRITNILEYDGKN